MGNAVRAAAVAGRAQAAAIQLRRQRRQLVRLREVRRQVQRRPRADDAGSAVVAQRQRLRFLVTQRAAKVRHAAAALRARTGARGRHATVRRLAQSTRRQLRTVSSGRRARLNRRSGAASGLAATVCGHELRRGLPSRRRGPSGGSAGALPRGCQLQMAAMSRLGGRLRFAMPALCAGLRNGRSPSLPRTCARRGSVSVDRGLTKAARSAQSHAAAMRAATRSRVDPCCLRRARCARRRRGAQRARGTSAQMRVSARHAGGAHLAPPRQHPPAARCSVRPRLAWRRQLQPAPRRVTGPEETGNALVPFKPFPLAPRRRTARADRRSGARSRALCARWRAERSSGAAAAMSDHDDGFWRKLRLALGLAKPKARY